MAKWYVVHGDQERGPFDDAQLKVFAANGKLKPNHQIRRDGSDTARPAKNIKGLFQSHRPDQIDQKQIPPPLPDSKATTTRPPSEKGNSPPPLPPSNLGKNIGVFCGIIVLLMGGIRGCLQVTAGKNNRPATATSQHQPNLPIESTGQNQNTPTSIPQADSPSKPDIPLIANGRVSAARLISFLKRVYSLKLVTPDIGTPPIDRALADLSKTIHEPCRLHIGTGAAMGQNVSVVIVQHESDELVPMLILSTSFDPNMPVTRGNDLSALESIVRRLLPEVNVRKLAGEQILGDNQEASSGKSRVTLRYNHAAKEMRVIIFIDEDARPTNREAATHNEPNQIKTVVDVWQGGTKAEFISRIHAFNLKDFPNRTFQCEPDLGIFTTFSNNKSDFFKRFGRPDSESPDFENSPSGFPQSEIDKYQIWSYSCSDGVLKLRVQPSQDGKLYIRAAKK